MYPSVMRFCEGFSRGKVLANELCVAAEGKNKQTNTSSGNKDIITNWSSRYRDACEQTEQSPASLKNA